MRQNIWIMNHYASTDYQDRGGRHYNLSKCLMDKGYNPVVFCAQTMHNTNEIVDLQGCLYRQIEAPTGVPFVFVKCRSYVGNGKQRILNMVEFYCNVKKSAKEYAAQCGKPDVIYASSVHPLTLVAGIQLARYFGVRCICEVRDLWPESLVVYGIASPKNPAVLALRWLEKWIYQKADAMVFTMEGAYDYIVKQHWEEKIPRSKVFYINNGVDLEAFLENQSRYSVDDPDLTDPNTFKVVYTGSIRKANGLDQLVKCAEHLRDKPNIRFLIYGAGEELEHYQSLCREQSLTNCVFKGRVPKSQVPYILSKGDINVLNYSPETKKVYQYGSSQNKLFDYLASGKPIVSNIDIPYSPVTKWKCGISEDLTTGELYRDAILRIYQLPEADYQTMCENAARAAQEYDFEVLTEKLIAVIEGEKA